MILSFPIFPDARSPRANADAIFPAPIKPTDDILRDMTSIKYCINDVSVDTIVIFYYQPACCYHVDSRHNCFLFSILDNCACAIIKFQNIYENGGEILMCKQIKTHGCL